MATSLTCSSCGGPYLKPTELPNIFRCQGCRQITSFSPEELGEPEFEEPTETEETQEEEEESTSVVDPEFGMGCLGGLVGLGYCVALLIAAASANPTLYINIVVVVLILIVTWIGDTEKLGALVQFQYTISLGYIMCVGIYLCFGLTWGPLTNIIAVFLLNLAVGLVAGFGAILALFLVGYLLGTILPLVKSDKKIESA